jgi:hypothetical protein
MTQVDQLPTVKRTSSRKIPVGPTTTNDADAVLAKTHSITTTTTATTTTTDVKVKLEGETSGRGGRREVGGVEFMKVESPPVKVKVEPMVVENRPYEFDSRLVDVDEQGEGEGEDREVKREPEDPLALAPAPPPPAQAPAPAPAPAPLTTRLIFQGGSLRITTLPKTQDGS